MDLIPHTVPEAFRDTGGTEQTNRDTITSGNFIVGFYCTWEVAIALAYQRYLSVALVPLVSGVAPDSTSSTAYSLPPFG